MSSKHRFLERLNGSLGQGTEPILVLMARQRRSEYFALITKDTAGTLAPVLLEDDDGRLKLLPLANGDADLPHNLERHLRSLIGRRFPGAAITRILDKTRPSDGSLSSDEDDSYVFDAYNE